MVTSAPDFDPVGRPLMFRPDEQRAGQRARQQDEAEGRRPLIGLGAGLRGDI
jgi:hypothetical protein